MAGIKIKIDKTGLGQLQNILRGLSKRDAKNKAKRRFVAFAAGVRDQLRAVEPKRTGGLKKGTKSKSTQGGGAVVYGEHPRAAHANIVRKGTQPRRTKKGADRGSMPASDAMQSVLDRAETQGAAELAELLAADLKANVEARTK